MDGRIDKMVIAHPMISSRVMIEIKVDLKLPASTVTIKRRVKPSYWQEAPVKSHCWKNYMLNWLQLSIKTHQRA